MISRSALFVIAAFALLAFIGQSPTPPPTITCTTGAVVSAVGGTVVSTCVTPSAPPTISPPTPTPTLTPFTNGQEYPSSFRPFSDTSPWNRRVSAAPLFAAYSAALVASQFAAGNDKPVRSQEAGPYDYAYSFAYASNSDPLVNLACTGYCDNVDHGGLPAQIRIPARTRAPGFGGVGCTGCYEDAPLAIIQPDGTEIDTAYSSNGFAPRADWRNGDTYAVGGAASCGPWTTGDGLYGVSTGATAGGHCLAAGVLRANELAAGRINHALKLLLECQGAQSAVYPAFPNAQTQTCTGGPNAGPPLGGRLWYDVPCATTILPSARKAWENAILCALNEYGGYFMDNYSGGVRATGMGFIVSGGEMFYDFAQPSPYAALGWSPSTIPGTQGPRYTGSDAWNPAGVNFAAHMHWLAPCSAQGTC